MLFDRVKKLSKEQGQSLKTVSKNLGLSENAIYKWKNQNPNSEVLNDLADYFNVSVDYLLGRTDKKRYYDLTDKDERDIQKKLQELIEGLNNSDGYAAFDGSTPDELDEEDKELLIASLENTLRLSKRLAKKKFTPKKYRK